MSDKNAGHELLSTVKAIVDNYMRNRKPAAIVLGVYTGDAVMIGSLPVPLSLISGNMKEAMVSGDKVRLFRNDGGREYYVLEIIGKPYQLAGE